MIALLWCPWHLWMRTWAKAPGERHPSASGCENGGGELKWLGEASGSFSAHVWGTGPPRGRVIDPFTSRLTAQRRFREAEPRGPPCRASIFGSSLPSPTEAWSYAVPLLHPSTGYPDLRGGEGSPISWEVRSKVTLQSVDRRGCCGAFGKYTCHMTCNHHWCQQGDLQNSLTRMLY